MAEDQNFAVAVDLDTAGRPRSLVDTLRQKLGDPSLTVVYWRPANGHWIDERGHTTTLPMIQDVAFTAIDRGGEPIAALVHDRLLLSDPERLRAAILAAADAIVAGWDTAELRTQLLDERASRIRIIEAGDLHRRQVERNLHDGAQQRLVGTALTLRVASRKAAGDPAMTELLNDAASDLDDALHELRELSRGLHPAIVSDAGLAAGLETLSERPGVPVSLSVDLPGRLPDVVEVGAYYLVAEALANAMKHAAAEGVTVRVRAENGWLRVAVSDDGRGGAVATPGSGLEGLTDRIGALGGRLVIDSPTGLGTTVTAAIPLRVHERAAMNDPMDRRLTALKWIGWQNWEAPPETEELQTDEDNLNFGKALLLAVGGNSQITQQQRDWIVGYLTAAGDSPEVIEAVRTYDDSDLIDDIMSLPKMAFTRRGVLYDGLRLCYVAGTPDPGQLERVFRSADAIGIPREEVAELQQIVAEDRALQRRRYELIVVPVLPLISGERLRRPAAP
jgi:signal transduction histidine kinase